MTTASYAVAIGSNRRGRNGAPADEVRAAIDALGAVGCVTAVAPIIDSAPLGPSHRRYANTVALIDTNLAPPAMLAAVKAIERRFGRRAGRRWGSRVVDLDLILWSRGSFMERKLTVPHPAFRTRHFVLGPLSRIAPDWRDPSTRLSVRQLCARLARPKRMVDRGGRAS